MLQHIGRMEFPSKMESLCMIPELPSLEDHYTSLSAMNISPAASPRREPTQICIAKKREKRKSIVHQSLINALRILDESDECCSSTEFLDSSMTSIATTSTAPLTDDERETNNNSSFVHSTKDDSETSCPSGAPILGRICRWESCTKSRDSSDPSRASKKTQQQRQQKQQQHHQTNFSQKCRHFRHDQFNRRKRHDRPPVCPVRRSTTPQQTQQVDPSCCDE